MCSRSGRKATAFFGTGDPDSNGDGVFDLADDPDANGAQGLQIIDFEFGLALMKPVSIADHSQLLRAGSDCS